MWRVRMYKKHEEQTHPFRISLTGSCSAQMQCKFVHTSSERRLVQSFSPRSVGFGARTTPMGGDLQCEPAANMCPAYVQSHSSETGIAQSFSPRRFAVHTSSARSIAQSFSPRRVALFLHAPTCATCAENITNNIIGNLQELHR